MEEKQMWNMLKGIKKFTPKSELDKTIGAPLFQLEERPAYYYGAGIVVYHDSRFSHEPGGAITDDHLEFIKAGIPAIDIIACHGAGGFPPYWHTVGDNMDNISAETLGAVGRTVMTYLKHFLKQT